MSIANSATLTKCRSSMRKRWAPTKKAWAWSPTIRISKSRPIVLGHSRNRFPAANTMFDPDRNGAAATARAFATYSLVPYLGILFCPGAVLMGASGVYQSYRRSDADGRGAGYGSI